MLHSTNSSLVKNLEWKLRHSTRYENKDEILAVTRRCECGAGRFVPLDRLALLAFSTGMGLSEGKELRWIHIYEEVAFVDVLRSVGELATSSTGP